MPVFISYSHRDSDFAELLATQLVKHKARVWIDKWELQVGDSLIERIQAAIAGASALLVLLSKASAGSEWCKKELSSGLIRELEEKRVVVLPVLIEDCEIPLFLRDKLYADFRKNFDDGLHAVLAAVARVTSESMGRADQPEYHFDWSVDYGMMDDRAFMQVTMVGQPPDEHYSLMTLIRLRFNDRATKRYLAFREEGLDFVQRITVIEMLASGTYDKDLRVLIEDEKPRTKRIVAYDPRTGCSYEALIEVRRLGEDNGKDVLVDLGGQLREIRAAQLQTGRPLTDKELAAMKRIQVAFEK